MKNDRAEAPKITWGPVAAIAGSVIIYFVSQVMGSALLLGIASLKGLSGDQVSRWVEKTGPQFLYIAAVEGAALLMLWAFLNHRKASFKTLGLIRPKWKDLGYVFVGFGIYFPLLIASTLAMKAWFPSINLDQQQQIGFEAAKGFFPLLLVFISLVVLPPFTEEVLTRGFLYLGLKTRLPRYIAIIITSIMFSIAHLQFGSGAPLLWSAAVDTFILSVVLIFLRETTGALWSSIGLHMLKNSIAFCALFIFVK